jgi:hypothetical protein
MTRHEKLCEAVRQMCKRLSEQGRTIGEVPTAAVVDACCEVIPDATPDEIGEALRVVGQEYTTGMREVAPADLTPVEVNKICADLFLKAEAWLGEVKESRDLIIDGDDPEETKKTRARTEKERGEALGFVVHICELRAYWARENPGQKLLPMNELMAAIAGRWLEIEWTFGGVEAGFRYVERVAPGSSPGDEEAT